MAITIHVHRQAGIRLMAFSGPISPADFAALADCCADPARFDPDHISFVLFSRDVDLFEVEIADFVDLDSALSEAFKGAARGGTLRAAVVAERASVKADLAAWRDTTRASDAYTYEFEMFADLAAAVRWHGLTPDWTARLEAREGFQTVLDVRETV